MADDNPEESTVSRAFEWDATDRARMLSAIAAHDQHWHPPKRALGLRPDDWKPDFIAAEKRALHLHLAPSAGDHWLRRVMAASTNGYGLTVAAPESDWLADVDSLISFGELDVRAIVLRREGQQSWKCREYRSIPVMIAAANLRLEREARRTFGLKLLAKALSATAPNERGDRFEDILALLFSQITFLTFHSINRVNATEELDLVFGNHAVGWALPPSPVVLVSAKNYGDPVGTSAVNDLTQKMDNRFGQCSLGLLCVSDVLSSRVMPHIQRLSQGRRVIVPFDGARIRSLLESDDLDKAFEELVIQTITS